MTDTSNSGTVSVPREDLKNICEHFEFGRHWQAMQGVEKLRAILAQPAEQQDHPYSEGIAHQLERTDWTPEEALRWYAEGKHFDVADGRTRIIDTGHVASNALKHFSLTYLEMKGDSELTELRDQVAGQQDEPVAIVHRVEYEDGSVEFIENPTVGFEKCRLEPLYLRPAAQVVKEDDERAKFEIAIQVPDGCEWDHKFGQYLDNRYPEEGGGEYQAQWEGWLARAKLKGIQR